MQNLTDYIHLWELFQLKYSVIFPFDFTNEESFSISYFGSRNIIFSAPHSVSHMREKSIKSAEVGTGGLTEVLAMLNQSISICSVSCRKTDPNWDYEENPYKKALRSLSASFNNNFVLFDIHGCKDLHGLGVNFGLGSSPNKKGKSIVENASTISKKYNIEVSVDGPFNAKRKSTITSFCQSLGGTAIQIEIARKYRVPNEENELANDLIKFLMETVSLI